jgi:peptide-methionine (R)-S-oxide reductase
MMLKWPDVLNLAKSGNPAPDRKVVKTEAEWREQLVTRNTIEKPPVDDLHGRCRPLAAAASSAATRASISSISIALPA